MKISSPLAARRREVLERWRRACDAANPPTREAWGADLRGLGPVDLETASALSDGGARWPWIPPFEAEQLEELLLRAIEPGAARLLHQAARTDLAKMSTSRALPGISPEVPGTGPSPEVPGPSTEAAAEVPGTSTEATEATEEPGTAREVPAREVPGTYHQGTAREVPGTYHHRTHHHQVESRLRRRLRTAAYVLTTAALLVAATFSFRPPAAPPSPAPTALPPAPAEPQPPPPSLDAAVARPVETAAPPEPAPGPEEDIDEVAPLVLELVRALEMSDDVLLQEIYLRNVAPLTTLPPKKMRRRPEMAQTIEALLAAGAPPTSRALLECGWIGDEPRANCLDRRPLEPLRALIDWVARRRGSEPRHDDAGAPP